MLFHNLTCGPLPCKGGGEKPSSSVRLSDFAQELTLFTETGRPAEQLAGYHAKQATVDSGYWSECGAELVEIPAALGLDGGVWYAIRQGMRGVMVQDERGIERVYLVCELASSASNGPRWHLTDRRLFA
jgi:hypothetical protein